MVRIKTYLANVIHEQNISTSSIDECLTEMSQLHHQRLLHDFKEYGLASEHFYVTTIVKPEEASSYHRFKELHFC